MQTVPQVSASLALDTPLLLILVLASAAISIALALLTVPGIVAKSQSSLTCQGKLPYVHSQRGEKGNQS